VQLNIIITSYLSAVLLLVKWATRNTAKMTINLYQSNNMADVKHTLSFFTMVELGTSDAELNDSTG